MTRTFNGHSDVVRSVSFSSNGRFLATASNTSAKLWDTKLGTELISLFTFGDNDFVATNSNGLFDLTEGAKDAVYFVNGLDVYELDQFFEQFYSPNILVQVLSGKEVNLSQIPCFY